MSTYIIAEAGIDHAGDFERLRKLLTIAQNGHADAFKMQYYRSGTPGVGRTLPDISFEMIQFAQEVTEASGMDFLCTPHDEWALDQLRSLKLDKMKIGSGDWHLLPVIAKAEEWQIILSTGMRSATAVKHAADMYLSEDDIILECTSVYPCSLAQLNLSYMKWMQDNLPQMIGLSDHTPHIYTPAIAVAAGAQVIEKHICIEPNQPGRQDTFCALDGGDFRNMVKLVRETEVALSYNPKNTTPEELPTKRYCDERLAYSQD